MTEFKRSVLTDVVMGRESADLVIRNGTWICVQSGEFIEDTDIAVKQGRIAYVGPDASAMISTKTKVIEAENRYLVPGLLDAHMHVESGMLTVTEFVRAVLPRGTTGMFIDPHEIANVFGLKGVKLMVDEASRQPSHVWVQVPSCVPSAPGLESSGADITPLDVREALNWEGIIGLGEVMNYPGVAAADQKMMDEIDATKQAGKVVGGHYAARDLGKPFHAYVAGGPEDDHEGTIVEDAVARVRQGMKAMIRYSSAWQDLAVQVKAITQMHLDPRHFILCTDDVHAETLINEGHMDRVVRHAIENGVAPMTAIQMATLNTAEHFGLWREVGSIAPGRWADVLLVKDLQDFRADVVIVRGVVAAEQGDLLIDLPQSEYPDWALNSVHLQRLLVPSDFRISVDPAVDNWKANVIGVIENQAPTKHLIFDVTSTDGEIRPDLDRDLVKLSVIERHHGIGSIQTCLVNGFGLAERCAIASTVAHDCHQLLVLGTDDDDMALAANHLAKVGGGQVVVNNGKIIASIELPLAGLMSIEQADVVANKAAAVLHAFQTCGCKLNNPNMTMSLLALVVIPDLRLSDKGLVDVNKFQFITIFTPAG